MRQRSDRIVYFHGIDLLRGLAAVTILIWHYQQFYYAGAPVVRSAQPFYGLLWPLYEYGFWAVDLFWIISGFVFSHVYAGKETSGAAYAQARFARLYPLHFLTLIVVTGLQAISVWLTGTYQIAPASDPIGFVQQLLFVSAWGFPHWGHHFNSPVWSVSIEVLIYVVFFFTARRVFVFGALIPASLSLACWLSIYGPGGPTQNFPTCGFFFFAGSAIYYWVLRYRDRPWLILVPSAAGLAAFAYLARLDLPHYSLNFFLFAPMVLLVGWLDTFRPPLQGLRWFGNTTYSTYLWHFPIQVAIMIPFACFGWSRDFFNQPAILIAWLVGMVWIAHLSFRYIEQPAQDFLKAKFREASPILPGA